MLSFVLITVIQIDKNILLLTDMNRNVFAFNNKTKQIDSDLRRMKAKSFDLADCNIKLYKTSENFENELQMIKHKLLCNNRDILLLYNKIDSFKKM